MLGDVFMLRTCPHLERDLDSLPAKVHVVGPCAWEPDLDDTSGLGNRPAWDVLRAELSSPEAPIIYVHNGRTFGGPTFWPQLMEGLASAPIQVVASVGRMDTAIGPLPENFLARDHVPQGLVLPHARAVIAGGHSSVVIGAILHGVPSVLIPYGVETPENSERLTAAGCAIVLDIETLTSGNVRGALERVITNDEMRERCGELSRAFRAAGSFSNAACLIEAMAARRGPVLRASGKEKRKRLSRC